MKDRYHAQPRNEMRKFLPDTYSKVLEIGCGAASFRKNLMHCEYWGIEPNENAAATAALNPENNILTGTYEQIAEKLPNNYFDLVICNDVIEHMPDHDKFFNEIQRHMTPDGTIIGSIPNIRYFTSLFEIFFLKDFRYRDSDIFDKTHLRFFTKTSIKRSISSANLHIEKLEGINSFILKRKRPIDICISIIICIAILLSLFYFTDIKFMQYGFRASRKRA